SAAAEPNNIAIASKPDKTFFFITSSPILRKCRIICLIIIQHFVNKVNVLQEYFSTKISSSFCAKEATMLKRKAPFQTENSE
ncbi:MAG: hypothetical protein K6F27_11010, partial [Ruminococcus sp.]|nr:hypothetical protein [Ruminococcus sp.]